jgi:hypothetical protein
MMSFLEGYVDRADWVEPCELLPTLSLSIAKEMRTGLRTSRATGPSMKACGGQRGIHSLVGCEFCNHGCIRQH